jgi:hypothetical protein
MTTEMDGARQGTPHATWDGAVAWHEFGAGWGTTGMVTTEWGQWTACRERDKWMAWRTRPLRADKAVKASAMVGSGRCSRHADESGRP